MKFLLEGACDGDLLTETIEAATQDDAQALAIERLRQAWGQEGDELSDFGDVAALRPYAPDDYARDAAMEMLAVCKHLLPKGICLTNTNVPDHFNVPLDATMGELRRLAAVIVKATGA